MNNFLNYLNLKVKTELLESLGWDEQLLSQLEEYLNTEFNNFHVVHPDTIIENVKQNFGEETSKVLSELFKDQLKSILIHNGGVIDEH